MLLGLCRLLPQNVPLNPLSSDDARTFVQLHTSHLSEQDRVELNDALRSA